MFYLDRLSTQQEISSSKLSISLGLIVLQLSTQQEINSSYIDSYLSLLASLFSSSHPTSNNQYSSSYLSIYLSLSHDLLVLQLSSQQVIINIAAAIYLSLLSSYVLS
jgi:hypothetical protein